MTIEDIRELVLSREQVSIGSGADVDLSGHAGIIEHDIDDQVVVVRAGTSLVDLCASLVSSGQTIPYHSPKPCSSVGALVARNWPHLLQEQHGSWRDWVIGMTIVRGDGTVAKCGSKAVKNVAGYDVQKLFIGSEGRLGVIVDITLRTCPIGALMDLDVESGQRSDARVGGVQRVLPSDFEAALDANSAELILADRAYKSLWLHSTADLLRFDSDWVRSVESNGAAPPHIEALDRRMKAIIDPDDRFVGSR